MLRHAVQSRVQRWSSSSIDRIEIEIEPTDVLHWLAGQPAGQRWFFRSREGTLTAAGIGCARSWTSLEEAIAQNAHCGDDPLIQGTNQPTAPLFFHSSFFDPESRGKHAPQWASFDRSISVLPLIELQHAEQTILAVHLGDSVMDALTALEECQEPRAHLPLPRGLRLSGDGDPVGWADGIDAALGAIASGSMEKVVLARTRSYCAFESIDPCSVLFGLMEEEPSAFHFMVEQHAGSAFVGASPERLFRRIANRLESEAVAGTCGRGPDGSSDDRLAGRLLGSDKNRREHEIVIRRIESVLAPMVDQLCCDESPSIMRLRHVQHLKTNAQGRLKPGINDATIVGALHPTPAVCGWPVDRSREFIRDHEHLSRGLYSGVIGVTSPARSDFSVAIRAALISGTDMTAFSGAGVVRGSDADAEWLETERKLAAFDALVIRAASDRAALIEPARTDPMRDPTRAPARGPMANVPLRLVAGS